MRKFLFYILALIGTSVILLATLDAVYTYVFSHGTPRNKIAHILSIEKQHIDYIFIGSSRVDNTIDAKVIEKETGKKAINLGVQGGKIDDFYLMLQLLKKQEITAETIFIQIDYIYNIEGNSEALKSSLMPYIHDEIVSNFIKTRDPEYLALKYLPFYRYLIYDYKIGFREFFNTATGQAGWIDLENGYFPLYGSSGKDLQGSLPDHIRNKNDKIRQINSFARANNLNVVYFMAPFCPDMQNLDFASKLQEKLPNFINFSRPSSLQNEVFYDCAHLNDKGAKEFSQIFAEKIKEHINNGHRKSNDSHEK